MNSHFTSLSKNWQQFRFLSKKLNRLLESGKFKLLSNTEQQKLITRLKELFIGINGFISKNRLKKVLAGATLLLGLAFSYEAKSQNFEPVEVNPFGLNLNEFSVPRMVDIDDDGDLDMFISEYSYTGYQIKYLENIGTATAPNFTGQDPVSFPFGIQLQGLDQEYLVLFDFADMDNDGDQDLIVGGAASNYDGGGKILYYENTGTEALANFGTPVDDPFGFQPTYYIALPDLVDIDNDGDFDLVVTEYYGNTQFFENVGTPEAPEFANAVLNPFGITPASVGFYTYIDLADIDDDGDMDLLKTATDYYSFSSIFEYQENIGTADAPNFAASVSNPFDFTNIGVIAIPNAVDVDDDGDVDVLFGNANLVGYAIMPDVLYFENTMNGTINTAPTSEDVSIDIDQDQTFSFMSDIFPFEDADGDNFFAVKITGLTSVGDFEFNGVPFLEGQVILASELHLLTYTPIFGEFGDAYDSFEFTVSDGEDFSNDAKQVTINVKEVVATNDLFNEATLKFGPNPTSDYIYLQTELINSNSIVQLSLLNVNGQLIKNESIRSIGNRVDWQMAIQHLTSGSYYLRLESEGHVGILPFKKN